MKSVSSYTSTPTVDEDVREMLKDWKQDQPTLLQRFDLNKDGKIDEIEWRLARAQARRETMKNRQEQVIHSADGLSVLGPTRDNSRPYILSAFTQAELTKRYKLVGSAVRGSVFLFGPGGGVGVQREVYLVFSLARHSRGSYLSSFPRKRGEAEFSRTHLTCVRAAERVQRILLHPGQQQVLSGSRGFCATQYGLVSRSATHTCGSATHK